MNKLFLLGLLVFMQQTLCAAPKMPNLDRWIKLSIPEVDKAKVMQKVLFVQKKRSKFIPWMPIEKKNENDVLNMNFLSIISPEDLAFCAKVNQKLTKKSSYKLPERGNDALEAYFKCSQADTIIAGGPKEKRWTFYKPSETEGVKKVYKAKGPASLEEGAILDWLKSKLGFDGIVLAKEGDFVLAGLMSEVKNTKIQALLLKDSQDKFKIRGKKGAALLQLLKVKNGYGLFEIVIESSKVKDAKYSKVLFNVK